MIENTRKIGRQLLEKRLIKIKDGDSSEREALISDYMPFIVKSVSKCMGKYMDLEKNDEFSIGLKAFDEAIMRYEFEKGNFISFAGLVIASRIKDYIKKDVCDKTVPLSVYDTKDGNVVENVFAADDFTYGLEIKDQMNAFKEQLETFGISMEQLVEDSPKHIDTRLRALEVAHHISRSAFLKNEFFRKKKLPYGEIREDMNVSQKMLRKSRNFIVAAVLIFSNDWPDLKNRLP